MRKQIENFIGCIILTGQESPETSRRLREDLWKKMISADGIPGRKPYGMITRMLSLTSWTRLLRPAVSLFFFFVVFPTSN